MDENNVKKKTNMAKSSGARLLPEVRCVCTS